MQFSNKHFVFHIKYFSYYITIFEVGYFCIFVVFCWGFCVFYLFIFVFAFF